MFSHDHKDGGDKKRSEAGEDACSTNRATYRILYFSANRLERWEKFEADDYVEAVQIAAQRAGDELTELWSARGRIATFRPRPHREQGHG